MNQATTAERTLTELDHARVARLLELARDKPRDMPRNHPGNAINDVLDRSELVSSNAVDADVVTMNSQVALRDLDTGESYRWTLCYPPRADALAGFISVLSPAGAGLLGRRTGSIARWTTPGGFDKAAEVLEILFQPEASGDYVL